MLPNRVERPGEHTEVKKFSPSEFGASIPDLGRSPLLSRLEKPAEETAMPVVSKAIDEVGALARAQSRLAAWEDSLLAKEKEIDELKKDVFSVAEEEGLKAGYREGWEESRRERESLVRLVEGLSAEFAEMKSKLASAVLELAVHAARHVVHESCSLSIDNAFKNISAVVNSYGLSSKSFVIKAHSKTIAAIKSHDPDCKVFGACTFEQDNGLELGGFYINHESGAVDSTIETRWQRAMSQLSTGGQGYVAQDFSMNEVSSLPTSVFEETNSIKAPRNE